MEICDKPVVINAANRYTNSTVRLFRDQSFWDLMSLPDLQAFTSEKMTLSAPMAPVPPRTSIVTILEGSDELKGRTFKFQKHFLWSWDEDGKQESGGRGGEYWDQLPKGGFDTMFHNGNQTKPMIIAFKDDLVCIWNKCLCFWSHFVFHSKVYYLSTNGEELEFIDSGINWSMIWISDLFKISLISWNRGQKRRKIQRELSSGTDGCLHVAFG